MSRNTIYRLVSTITEVENQAKKRIADDAILLNLTYII